MNKEIKKLVPELTEINETIKTNTEKHNEFLKELGLPVI
jgi:type I restriction enzyme M protein